MSVTTTHNRDEYVANGAQTSFPYTYKVFKNTDIEVYIDGVLQTLTTDYTVAGVGNEGGGSVDFLSAPANGAKVLLRRVLPSKQETVYPNADKFPAKVHEEALDRLTMLVQQLEEVDRRTLKLAVSSLFTDLLVPDPVAGKFLRWNALLSALENADIVPLGNLGLPVSIPDGGSGATTILGARQAYGLDGQVRRQYVNRTGVTLNAGDVVALSAANDGSVVLGDTQGSKAGFVVCLEDNLANLATGDFLVSGVADVAVQGACARGQYIRKSATSLKVEDAGTAHGAANDPPSGTLGFTIGAVGGGKALAVWIGHAIGASVTVQMPYWDLMPLGATLPSTNFPQPVKNLGTNVVDHTLDFDKDTSEAAYWFVVIPGAGPAFSGAVLDIYSRQASATSGNVGWRATTRPSKHGDGAAWDTAGTVDSSTFDAVQGTAGRILKQSITLTTTGWAAGAVIQIKIDRNAANVSDTLNEDCKFIGATLRLTA